MKMTNTLRFVALLSAIGLVSCKQAVIPDAELPEGWTSAEKVAKEFKVDNAASLGLPSIAEGDRISVFSTMSPTDNCEFIFQNSSFVGEVADGGNLIALYPYRTDAKLINEGGKLVLNTSIPYEQGICQIDGSTSDIQAGEGMQNLEEETTVGKTSEPGEIDDLYVSVDAGDKLNFKSLYSSVTLPVMSEYDLSVDSIRIQAKNGEHLSGNIGLTFNGDSFAGIRTPEVKSDKILYVGNLKLNKNTNVNIKFNLISGIYQKGFVVSLFNGNTEIVKEYNSDIDLLPQDNYCFDKFVVSLPDFYVNYKSDEEIFVDGYLSEYADGQGKIYFQTSTVPNGFLKGNMDIKSLTIPQEITAIGESAFEGCKNLTEVVFADNSNLQTIAKSAFNGASFANIEIPANVTTIGNYAFQNNLNLTDISFGEATFQENNDNIVTSVVSDSKLATLGEQILDGCKSLNCNIVLPESIKNIKKTFSLNPNNKNLIIYCLAATPPVVNENSFNSFSKILVKEDFVEEYKQVYAGYANVVNKIDAIGTASHDSEVEKTDYYVKYKSDTQIEVSYSNEYDETNGEGVVYFPNSIIPKDVFTGNINITEVELSPAITVLSESCFEGCTNLTKITLNEGLQVINKYACAQTGVSELHIPASVTDIKGSAFKNNLNLTQIEFGVTLLNKDENGNVISASSNSVLTNVGYSILDGCKLLNSDLVLPSSIREITNAFSLMPSNVNLVVCCLAEVPPTVNGSSFNSFSKIYVPKEYLTNYQTAYEGKAFENKLMGF